MKTCIHCKQEKETHLFTRHKKYKDGHSTTCVDCNKRLAKEWRIQKKAELTKKNLEVYESNVASGKTKKCEQCAGAKPYSEYAKNWMRDDGCVNVCKQCMNEYVKNIREAFKARGEYLEVKIKICIECGKNKKIEYFNKNCERSDGHLEVCIKCIAKRVRGYRKANPGRYAHRDSIKRCNRLKRIPGWANLKAIKEFYDNCPSGYVVDHVIPLQGEFVSGLHVLENLQYLTARDNAVKHNRIDLDAFNKQLTKKLNSPI
jgi:hypothetical protein